MTVKRPFAIREPATSEDFKIYYDLRWRILRAPWGRPRGSESDESETRSIHLMAVDEAEKIVGAGRVQFNSEEEGQIRSMAVEDAWQGRGVGGAILTELEKRAKARGVKLMLLDSRETAVKFYEKHGYRVESPSYTLFGTIPHFRMRKEL